mgnify:CR=1 FL=1
MFILLLDKALLTVFYSEIAIHAGLNRDFAIPKNEDNINNLFTPRRF